MFGEVSCLPILKVEGNRTREKIAFKTSLLSGSMKLIHDLPSDSWELYDLSSDPEELNDLFEKGHEALARLRAEPEAWERARAATAIEAGSTTFDAEWIEQLRQLGYVK